LKSFFKRPILQLLPQHLVDYPTPINIHYAWNFGFLLFFSLALQIFTGLFLAMHYTPHILYAFHSVEHIMRDVPFGWFLRYAHLNGASLFFILIYLHIFRALFYASYSPPRHWTWIFGVLIFFFSILTAFIGYVLPWGQMSLWGATVITNLLSAFPLFGHSLVTWIWGGFSVDNPTLHRFFTLHFLLPFLLFALSLLHMIALHHSSSGNPLGLDSSFSKIPLSPYFLLKDFIGLLTALLLFSLLLFFTPNSLAHPDNYILANPMLTPAHIVPEWYFLPFYAILRSIPHKLAGVLVMISSIAVLALLPWIHSFSSRSSLFRPLFRFFYFLFLASFFLLTWIGAMPVEPPFLTLGLFSTLLYFSFFLLLLPSIALLESSFLSSYHFLPSS